jgi:hypothetical protein
MNDESKTTEQRIYEYILQFGGSDIDEMAATFVDEDETAIPGSWAACGFDRGGAISEYLYEIDLFFGYKA